jgi:hypothetical protein
LAKLRTVSDPSEFFHVDDFVVLALTTSDTGFGTGPDKPVK